jgi:hypothetical protein
LKTIADAISPTHSSISYLDKIEVIDDCSIALRKCFELANKNDIVCATGSIYLAAGLRSLYLNKIVKKEN